MALFIEDTEKVTKKQIPIPQKAKEMFKAMKGVYEPYLDKVDGGKVLKSLASDTVYNKKGATSNSNAKDTHSSVSVEDAKKRLERQDKFAPNSIQYQLYGGELAHNIMKKGIEQSRRVQAVDKVEPPKPTTNTVKPSSGKIENKGKKIYVSESQLMLFANGFDK